MFEKEYKYLIRYTNENGERKTYMNIGFDTLESAQNELRKIKNQREKLKGLGAYLNRTDNYELNRACIAGKNFRIKKVSVIVHDLIFKKINKMENHLKKAKPSAYNEGKSKTK